MLKTFVTLFIICVILIGIAMLFLSVRLIFKKNGRFVKMHVSQSKAMRDKGITCVQSQDYAMRHKSPHAVKECEIKIVTIKYEKNHYTCP